MESSSFLEYLLNSFIVETPLLFYKNSSFINLIISEATVNNIFIITHNIANILGNIRKIKATHHQKE